MLGKTIANKYKITAQVGVGGMGCVYRAEHNVLGRQSALKVLHAQLNSDKTFIERFMREARAMARLDHDNIVRIYDVFEEDGLHFIAMELFEGPSLKAVIEDQGRLSLQQTVSIISQCARGLAYAHAQGIVHRDIKPSNIMLNSEGRIKITDFGIAAAMDDAATLTNTGQLVGTPRYMSPEQAKNGDIDRRSDLYSLGIVFYELVTGRTPFDGDSGVAIIGKLAYESSELELEFPDSTPNDMQELIRKMLLRHQEERIQHATHLMAELSKLPTKSNDIHKDSTIASSLSLVPIEEIEKAANNEPFKESGANSTVVLSSESRPGLDGSLSHPSAAGLSGNYNLDNSNKQFTYQLKSKTKPIAVAAVLLLSTLAGLGYFLSETETTDELAVSKPNSEDSTLAIVVQKQLYQLLEKKTSVELEMNKALELTANRQSRAKFGSASDKFLIAEGAITAIERDIKNKNYQNAKLSISRANNVFESASLLFQQARKEVVPNVSINIFEHADQLKKLTLQAARKLRNEKFTGAFKHNYQKAARLTKQATRKYDKAKLQFDLKNIDQAKALLAAVRFEYSEAETIYTNLAGYIQGQEVIDHVYSLRSKLNSIQARIVASKQKADKNNAQKLAASSYNKAVALYEQFRQGAKEAKKLLAEKDYGVAGQQFDKMILLAGRVEKEFMATGMLAQQQQQQPKPQAKTIVATNSMGTPKISQSHRPSRRDIAAVEKMLRQFKDVYESRNISQLQRIVDLSPTRLQTAKAIFNQFNEIHLSVTSYSLANGGGTAKIRIEKVVTANGDDVVPSEKWRDATLELIQNSNGNGWRKLVWR